MEEKKELTANQRNLNLDLIRCVANLFVLGIHYLGYCGFFDQKFAGRVMYVMTAVHTLCMTSVPMFMLLTGYLCCNRTWEKGYCKKLIPFLSTYVLACIFTIAFRSYIWYDEFSLVQVIFSILNVEDGVIGYGWYVNMYVGLFLLMPFLNGMYHSIQTKEQKRKLIVVLFVITVVPTMLNVYNWFTPGILMKTAGTESYQRIFPFWWVNVWPMLYYFTGAYIREYGIEIKKETARLLFLVSWIAMGTYVFIRSYKRTEIFEASEDYWNSFCFVIPAILLFISLLGLNLSRMPRILRWIIGRFSKLSYGIYLCSFLSDAYMYALFNQLLPDIRMRYIMMPVAVLASYCMAAIMSQLIEWIMAAPKWVKKHIH